MSTYTQDHLVEQPAIQLMQHEQGWEVVNCYGGRNAGVINQGPDGKRGWCWSRGLQRLGLNLPVESLEGS